MDFLSQIGFPGRQRVGIQIHWQMHDRGVRWEERWRLRAVEFGGIRDTIKFMSEQSRVVQGNSAKANSDEVAEQSERSRPSGACFDHPFTGIGSCQFEPQWQVQRFHPKLSPCSRSWFVAGTGAKLMTRRRRTSGTASTGRRGEVSDARHRASPVRTAGSH